MRSREELPRLNDSELEARTREAEDEGEEEGLYRAYREEFDLRCTTALDRALDEVGRRNRETNQDRLF